MFKRFFLVFFSVLGSFILIFTIYRASAGLGPLNLSATVELLGDNFKSSSNQLSETFKILDEASEGLLAHYVSAVRPSLGLSAFSILDIGYFFLYIFSYFSRLLYALVKFFVIAVQDVADLLSILGYFIIDSSPYPVAPYFP